MAQTDIISSLLTALRKIGETDQVLPATGPADWKRRAQIIARNAVEDAEKSLRRNRNEGVTHD